MTRRRAEVRELLWGKLRQHGGRTGRHLLARWQPPAIGLWDYHPEAAYFLGRGGEAIAPPTSCNLALTNKCNLRCEICGSQKFLDGAGAPRRRHMDFDTFQAVAETIFPFLVEVELNSQGDPLLYPRIEEVLEAIAAHGCRVKIQTNGTLLSDRVIERLLTMQGTLMFSLDAVGPRFDEVRRGGRWEEAEPQLRKLFAARDRRRLRIGVYPTITRRTLRDVIDILRWCAEVEIDEVAFHHYVPIPNSTEEAPSPAALKSVRTRVSAWLDTNRRVARRMRVHLDGVDLNRRAVKERTAPVRRGKGVYLRRRPPPTFPLPPDHVGADPQMLCGAPFGYVEVGMRGEVGACCRSQDVLLGYATSVEAFADVWFGPNYGKLRASLLRDATGPYPLPNCEACVRDHAPEAAAGRRASDYSVGGSHATRLDFGTDAPIVMDAISLGEGYCNLAPLPPGLDPARFELWEGEKPLGPGNCLHDDIRQLGQGRYSIWGRELLFSASDNTDARRNERSYTLRRIPD